MKEVETEPGNPHLFFSASEDGMVRLSLKYPDILPVLANCEIESTRKAMNTARETAYGDNLELMAEGVSLRKRIATLLGYESWAHFVPRR